MQSNFYRSLTGLGALLLASAVWGQGHIDSVTAKSTGDSGATISIVGQGLPAPKVSRAYNYYILQFDAKMDGGNRKIAVDAGGVDSAKLTWYSRRPSRVRLTMHTDGQSKPRLQKSDTGWCVYFGDAKPVASAPKQTAQEAFPSTVPTIQAPHVTATETMPAVVAVNREMQARVTLDFVNTDVVQILKALAMQANVNIVTSADVAGKLTVSLGSVPLGQAMDFVTTMSGVRYTRLGDTYVVATPAKFADMVQALGGHSDLATETRVIPLYSHQGAQVKASVLKAEPVSTLLGKYDLLLSSENLTVIQAQNLTPQTGTELAGDKGKEETGSKPTSAAGIVSSTQPTKANQEDNYMVIVATPARLDEIERMARAIDARICEAMGIRVPQSNGIVQKTYEPRGISAEEMVTSMKSDKSYNFGDVQMYATPKTSLSRQVVVVSGHSNDVENMLAVLNSMDSLADGGPTDYEIVGLKFVRPQLAMVDVIDAVPGIRAKLLPAPVEPNVGMQYTDMARQGTSSNPNNGGPQGANGNNGGAAAGGAAGGSGSGGSGSGGSGGSSGGSGGSSGGASGTSVGVAPTKTNEGVTDYSADVKTFQTPMRLLLKGTPQQLEQAKRFLALVDVAPKQVAIELRVMQITREEAMQVGLDLSLLTGGSLQSLKLNNSLSDGTSPGGINGKGGFKGGGTLSVLGKLDQIGNRNNLIARPSILASDGALTRIFVGDEVRYVESVTNSQSGPSVITNKVDVGVDFYVTARVGAEGNLTLELHPTFSILTGFTPVGNGGQLPQTSTRTADTIVNIKSGETLAIGGLIQDQDKKNYGGIPILKDLPLIGRLFGRTDNDKIRTEVVFFITAREVDETNRQGTANPKQAEHDNTSWPGGGPKPPKSGGN